MNCYRCGFKYCVCDPDTTASFGRDSPDKAPPEQLDIPSLSELSKLHNPPTSPLLSTLTALELCQLLVDDPTLELILIGPNTPRLQHRPTYTGINAGPL